MTEDARLALPDVYVAAVQVYAHRYPHGIVDMATAFLRAHAWELAETDEGVAAVRALDAVLTDSR